MFCRSRKLIFSFAIAAAIWVYYRLPETLAPENVIPIEPHALARAWGKVLFNRNAAGYMMGAGIVQGALFGYLNSSPQMFDKVFGAADFFTIGFAIVAIGIFNIPVFARLARGGALALWPRDFVRAARVAGKGRLRISLEHILPNIASVLIVQGTIQFSLGVLAEAGLSYVGLGAQPPAPSWGRMLAESQTYFALAPWLALAPGLAIVTTVLGLNMLGDGLRDLLDPRIRRERAI